MSEGLSAVYRFEAKIDSASATQVGGDRLSYVGLSGGFGNLTLGRIGAAGGGATGGILDNSFHYGNSYTGFRHGNAVSYSNSLGGINVQLDAVMDPKKNSDGAIDEVQFGMSLNLGDLGRLAVAHVNVEDSMMDSMVDLTIRAVGDTPVPGRYTINADGVVTGASEIVWETKDTKAVFDAKSAKNLALTHTHGSGANKVTVHAMKIYHASGVTLSDSSGSESKATMKDGKLVLDSCTTGCTESTTVWVSSAYPAVTTASGDSKKTYTVRAGITEGQHVDTTATATVTETTPGEKANHIAAEFGFGAVTAFLGYSQIESNMTGAKKDKITHYGIRGGLGESGVNFLVQARSEDLQGSAPKDADRNPYVVNFSKSLGDGATAYIEHGTQDAKDEKAKTRIGMIVNF